MLILVAAHCRINSLYELFATYWSRGLYYPRLIFSISWFSYMHALILTFNRKTVDSSVIWTRTLLGTVCRSISWAIRQYKPRLHYNVLGTAFAAVLLFFGTARHGTARLHLSFCRECECTAQSSPNITYRLQQDNQARPTLAPVPNACATRVVGSRPST